MMAAMIRSIWPLLCAWLQLAAFHVPMVVAGVVIGNWLYDVIKRRGA